MSVPLEWRRKFEDQGIRIRTDPGGDTLDLFATLERLDWNLGRRRSFLAANGLAENTIPIFMTDNGSAKGAHIFNAGMRGGKGLLTEGGRRVPCFLHWPAKGEDKPVDIDRFTAHLDLLPTLVDLCGLKAPARGHLKFDGRSFAPLLADPKAAWADRLIMTRKQNIIEVPKKEKNTLPMTARWRLINKMGSMTSRKIPGNGTTWRKNILRSSPASRKSWMTFGRNWGK